MTDLDALIREARDGLSTTRDQHHRRCATRQDEGCDCYARRNVSAHQALDHLADALETLRAEREAALAREAALRDALEGAAAAFRRLEEHGWADECYAALASPPLVAEDAALAREAALRDALRNACWDLANYTFRGKDTSLGEEADRLVAHYRKAAHIAKMNE
jgi:hypothetical protein